MRRLVEWAVKPKKTQISRARTLKQGISGAIIGVILILNASSVWAFQTETSFYTVKSCLAESGQATMANGKALKDENFTAAMWGVPFGTRVRITRVDRPDLSVIAEITDRGPAKRLCRKGRKLDVSLACAKSLGFVKEGLAQVEVEVLNVKP